ncbi:MAG: hypothetical protein D6701_10390, partial [Gemmatimonadetes bacterium]
LPGGGAAGSGGGRGRDWAEGGPADRHGEASAGIDAAQASGHEVPQRVSVAELARAAAAFLELVPGLEGIDARAAEDVSARLRRVADTLHRPLPLAQALGELRRHLTLRVRARWDEGSPPWKSSGGHVHLTDLEHGGLTGRRATFVVGLDAGRFPGHGLQDPLLGDGDRARLGADLPTSAERPAERRFHLAALAARVRGALTLSYTAWDAGEGRQLQPSPALLDALRFREGDPHLSYEDLRGALGRPVSAVSQAAPLDGADVWMQALAAGGAQTLADGLAEAREAFGGLSRGLRALEARGRPVDSEFVGRVEPAPPGEDPRHEAGPVVSASRLEALGTCGLKYLMRYVLRLRPPDDPEFEPDRWLDPRARGGLLHAVFERALRVAGERGLGFADDAFAALALETLVEEAREVEREIPPPSAGVRARELAQ